MIYNITVIYTDGKVNYPANVLCDCENDDKVIQAAFKWANNRWEIWQELCDAKKLLAIRIRDYPIGSPQPDGNITTKNGGTTGDSVPFFDWSNGVIKCPKGLKRNAQKYLKIVKNIS